MSALIQITAMQIYEDRRCVPGLFQGKRLWFPQWYLRSQGSQSSLLDMVQIPQELDAMCLEQGTTGAPPSLSVDSAPAGFI